MQIALLGKGPELTLWAQAARRRGWTVFSASGRPAHDAASGISSDSATADGPSSVQNRSVQNDTALSGSEDWEQLLGDDRVEAVLVSRDRHEAWREDALRKLAQAGIPLLIGFPPAEPMLALELDMIRQESHPGLLTHCPGQGHPLWQRIRDWLDDAATSPIGKVELLSIDVPAAGLNHDDQCTLLSQHCLLLRELVGPIERVSSVAGADRSVTGVPLQVTCTTRSGLLVRWSLVPAAGTPATQWKLLGDRGSACLTIPADAGDWTLAGDDLEGSQFGFRNWDESEYVLNRLQQVVDSAREDTSWTEACHALDLADAAVRSARRGRSLDLFETAVTEESAFKGAMAIGGCGVLLLVLFVLVMGSIFEGLGTSSGERSRQVQTAQSSPDDPTSIPGELAAQPTRSVWIRWWPVYPLLLFLVVQLLRIIARRAPSSSRSATPAGRS